MPVQNLESFAIKGVRTSNHHKTDVTHTVSSDAPIWTNPLLPEAVREALRTAASVLASNASVHGITVTWSHDDGQTDSTQLRRATP